MAIAMPTLNLIAAKNLKVGDYIYYDDPRKNGRPRAVITSIKTWKRNPDRILIGWKHGLYQHGKITEKDLSKWTTEK
jgi:hypothetical protein